MKKLMLMFALIVSACMCNATNYVGSSKFTDHVSVTLQGGVLTTFDNYFSGHTACAPIVVVGVDKYINPWFGAGIEGRTLIGNGKFNSHTAFDAVNVSGYAKFNILNMFEYKYRVFEPVVYTGLGWGHQTCSEYSPRNYMTYRAGLECNFNLNKSFAIIVNPSVVWGDINNGILNKHHGNFEVTAGVVYHFKSSEGSFKKVKPYDQDVIDLLNNRIAELKAEKSKTDTVTIPHFITTTYIVNFAYNSSDLNDRAKAELDKIPANAIVVIEATASPEGTKDYNQKLSELRAVKVGEYLENRGIVVRSAEGTGVWDEASGRQAFIRVVE
jgi:OmpA-OmpF porin, OOP family